MVGTSVGTTIWCAASSEGQKNINNGYGGTIYQNYVVVLCPEFSHHIFYLTQSLAGDVGASPGAPVNLGATA